MVFQSTPSVWRETVCSSRYPPDEIISIHSLRVEGDPAVQYDAPRESISIHSLRVEGDNWSPDVTILPNTISIHSLRVEGDGRSRPVFHPHPYFNPLPPCGGRHSYRCALLCFSGISIHSLRVEGDRSTQMAMSRSGDFNPLPPCGGRRCHQRLGCHQVDFNPLPPCGGRLDAVGKIANHIQFQSTPSVWRETSSPPQARLVPPHFNPLPPCGGRRDRCHLDSVTSRFQSTPSVWRETGVKIGGVAHLRNFNPLPPCGGRRLTAPKAVHLLPISIHSLRVEGDIGLPSVQCVPAAFQSTPSVWRETISASPGNP